MSLSASHSRSRLVLSRSRARHRRLWSHDGYHLYDKADILPLVDQDSHVIACDKAAFPADAISRKRSAAVMNLADGDDDVVRARGQLPPPTAYRLPPAAFVLWATLAQLAHGTWGWCALRRRTTAR